jgi:aerobic-type carbon monoxide dehydrogenase small subunit (CoxS/CutS family)
VIGFRPSQAAQIRRAAPVSFHFDGVAVTGHAGESLLAALLRAQIWHLRDAPGGGGARGGFCCMGLCQECVVLIDGRVVESCRQPVSAGMMVQSLKRDASGAG